MGSVTAVRNGPGILVSWPHRPDATASISPLHAIRRPPGMTSPSPIRSGAAFPSSTSRCFQHLNGRAARSGRARRRSRLRASSRLERNRNSRSLRTLRAMRRSARSIGCASRPFRGPPGKPHLLDKHAGAIYNVGWDPPADDHGDLVRGYRLHARIHSLNTSMLVLVANTSVDRPLIESFKQHERPIRASHCCRRIATRSTCRRSMPSAAAHSARR